MTATAPQNSPESPDRGARKTWSRLAGLFVPLFSPGLGRTLFCCFAFIGVFPLGVISLLSHQRAVATVHGYIAGSLEQTVQLASRGIESACLSRFAAAARQGRSPSTVAFATGLAASFKTSRQPAGEYVFSPAWRRLVSSHSLDFMVQSQADGFADAWLIDSAGNVLFAALAKDVIGGNMLTGQVSPVGQTVLRVMATGRQAVAAETNATSGGLRRLVVFSPISQAQGPVLGVLALFLPADFLSATRVPPPATGAPAVAVSLIGNGFFLEISRPGGQTDGPEVHAEDSSPDASLAAVSAPVVAGLPAAREPSAFAAFTEIGGLRPFGLDWRLMADVSEAEALGPMADLSSTMLSYLVAICLAVLLLAAFCSRWLVEPIRQLSDWARGVARGDLSERRIAPPDNEIGELCVHFRQVVRSFQEVADACSAISLGKGDAVAGLRGKDDVLGRLVNQMAGMKEQVENFRLQREELKDANEELAEQAQSLVTSKHRLRAEQDQLKVANDKLAARAAELLAEQEKVTGQYQQLEGVKKGLELRTRELEQVSRYKSEFLANMSHELRTPLNSMLILSRILADNKDANLSPRQVEFARTIHTSGANLLELISDILDLSRVEAGKISLRYSDVAIVEFAAAMERSFGEVAVARKILFTVEVDRNLSPVMYTDRLRLEQIVRNFLDNAFKFTEQGEVLLAIRKLDDAAAAGCTVLSGPAVSFAVFDTGIGFPPAKREEIFEEFQQGDVSISRRYGGSGLGLAICRKLTEMLGGEIIVQSVEGQGSSFTLLLPLVEIRPESVVDANRPESVTDAQAPIAGPAENQQLARYLAERRIIIVDQDMRTVFALTGFVEGWGVDVRVARNGDECLALLRQDPAVDFVLVDFSSPESRGCRTTAAIRDLEKCRDLPLIALLPPELADDAPECVRQGLATDCLLKPVDSARMVELFLRLERTFPRHGKQVAS